MISANRAARRRIVRLEWRLLTRNTAARAGVLSGPAAALVATVPAAFFSTDSAILVLMVYGAVALAPLSYASLAFSWNYTNAAHLFFLPIASRDHIEARCIVSGLLCLPAGLLLTAELAVFRPDLALLPLAGSAIAIAASLPLLFASIDSARSLDANAPALADRKKHGWKQWVILAVLLAPPFLLTDLVAPRTIARVLGAMGVVGIACFPFVLHTARYAFDRAIPALAERLYHREGTPLE